MSRELPDLAIESNIFNVLDSLGLHIEQNLVLDQNCKQLMARQQTGMFSIQRQIDYPFIPSINNFEQQNNQITGLEGIQVVQIAFPSEITYTNDDRTWTFKNYIMEKFSYWNVMDHQD